MIEDLNLPVLEGVAEARSGHLPPEQFDRWVNNNLDWIRQEGRLDRIRTQMIRRPANRRFRLV